MTGGEMKIKAVNNLTSSIHYHIWGNGVVPRQEMERLFKRVYDAMEPGWSPSIGIHTIGLSFPREKGSHYYERYRQGRSGA